MPDMMSWTSGDALRPFFIPSPCTVSPLVPGTGTNDPPLLDPTKPQSIRQVLIQGVKSSYLARERRDSSIVSRSALGWCQPETSTDRLQHRLVWRLLGSERSALGDPASHRQRQRFRRLVKQRDKR